MCVFMYVCMYVLMYGCMDVWMHGCMDAWKHGCMDVCMYVYKYVGSLKLPFREEEYAPF